MASGSDDDWDRLSVEPRFRVIVFAPRQARRPAPVSDDWEDDDDKDGLDNQQIWHDANTRAPMPHLITSPAAPTPPAAALPPAMRILKRPSAAPLPRPRPPAAPGETLRERGARYQAARDRIFAGSADGVNDKQSVGAGVVRNPKGPELASEGDDAGTDGPPKGFGARRAAKALAKHVRDEEAAS
ncbi:hypothetical protein B0H12DRAFT_1331695 [Mycena haematopus]|nr:hypothetical protein B0H12DRAFT_1331695 [Mycena haematopus]